MHFLLHPISSLNHLVARIVTDRITFLVAVIFFAYLSQAYKSAFWQSIDKKVELWAKNLREGFLQKHAEDFAIFGNAIFHILFCLVLALILFVFKQMGDAALALLFALIFSWAFNRFVKLIFKRERPRHIAGNVRRRLSYCFPSGHVMASISIYFFSAVVMQSSFPFLPWYLIALLISYLVISTRVYLTHHYFTDVLAGIALGIFCLDISIWFYFFLAMI